jgi:hypothetical protein
VERPHRRHGWAAPLVAALVVLAVALGTAYFLHPLTERSSPAIKVPPSPTLGTLVPPLVVRQRLGAPFAHVNGPAVPDAQLLAASPTVSEGLRLRTVGVERPHATPDAQGRPRVERCVYTYTDPDAAVLQGSCDWTAPAIPPEPDPPVTLEVLGAPGHTWVRGTAPAGTAAVLLRAPGRKDLAVPTAVAGPGWGQRPYYVAWWPRTGTDIVALDRQGHALGRTRLPSDVAMRHGADDPELGTMELPLGARRPIVMRSRELTPPDRVDVLARTKLSETITLLTLGFVVDGKPCQLEYVQDYRGGPPSGGGAMSCGASAPKPVVDIGVSRSYVLGTGRAEEQQLAGAAPAGTVRIRLTSVGQPSESIRAYDGGPRWQHRAFFIAAWPSAAPTRLEAFDNAGSLVAMSADRGLDPHSFDANYLAAEASCLRGKGADVTEKAQGQGPPAYAFNPGSLTTEQMRAAVDACEAEAHRVTG